MRCVCVFVVYQVSISQNVHVMGVQSCLFSCPCVCHKIICQSEISQSKKSEKKTFVATYCRSSRSNAIKRYWKLQNISPKHISKSENMKEIWESERKS